MTSKSGAQFPAFIAIKVSVELAQAVRRAARADDRPVSAFLRRLIAAAVGHQSSASPQSPDQAHG